MGVFFRALPEKGPFGPHPPPTPRMVSPGGRPRGGGYGRELSCKNNKAPLCCRIDDNMQEYVTELTGEICFVWSYSNFLFFSFLLLLIPFCVRAAKALPSELWRVFGLETLADQRCGFAERGQRSSEVGLGTRLWLSASLRRTQPNFVSQRLHLHWQVTGRFALYFSFVLSNWKRWRFFFWDGVFHVL